MGENSNSPSDTCIPRNRVDSRLLCTCHTPDPNLSTMPVLPYRILTAASYRRGNRGTERLMIGRSPATGGARKSGWRDTFSLGLSDGGGSHPFRYPPDGGESHPSRARLLTSRLPSLPWLRPPPWSQLLTPSSLLRAQCLVLLFQTCLEPWLPQAQEAVVSNV